MKTDAKPTSAQETKPAMNPALAKIFRAFVKGKIHHAYIFAGPEGVGKSAAAEELGAALLHFEALAETQLHGEAFRSDTAFAEVRGRVQRKMHPDFTWIEPEEKTLKVDDVRGLARELSYPPLQGKRRVIAIRDAQKMQAAAANAILKTLEEPPPYVVFLLLTTEAELLLPTILSRAQLVRFAPLSDQEIERLLLEDARKAATLNSENGTETKTATATVIASNDLPNLSAAVRWSGGSLTRALHYLGDEECRRVAEEATEALFRLWETSPSPAPETLAFLESLKTPAEMRIVLTAWLRLLQDAATAEAGADPTRFSHALRDRLYRIADKARSRPGKTFAERAPSIDLAFRELDANVNPKLALVALCGALRL